MMTTDGQPADGGQLAPLSDERLMSMRQRAVETTDAGYACDVLDLLTELDLLRAAIMVYERREAALLAVVRAVADVNATNGSDPDDMHWPCCAFSSTCEPVWSEHFIEWRHAADCPVTQARAALADAEAE